MCVRAVSDFTSGHVQCIFALSDTGSSSGSDSTFTLAVPAITLSHRRLTCALAPWLSTTQGIVTFRLFRGIGSFSKIHTSGGTQGAGVILDVPGDERYSWTEVQRTENGQDILATGITFTFLQVWHLQFLENSYAAPSDRRTRLAGFAAGRPLRPCLWPSIHVCPRLFQEWNLHPERHGYYVHV